MSYSVWQSFITDGGEQVVPGATVTVYHEINGAPATLYDGPDPLTALPVGNSVVSGADGLAKFFAGRGVYKIVATSGAFTKEFRHIQLGNAASRDVGTTELDQLLTVGDAVDRHPLRSEIGVADGVAGLDGSGKVPAGQLPSYVDDVIMYANLAAFPVSGQTGIIYVAEDTGVCYRWTGASYLKISDDDVQQFANLAAFPVSGAGATLYIADDTGLVYRWNGSAYAPVGLQPIADQTILGNVSGATSTPVALTKTQGQTLLDIGWILQIRNTASPNGTVPAHVLSATGAEANIDVVVLPKGSGAFLLDTPDSGATGGGKRGTYAVDLQMSRAIVTQVASGAYSLVAGLSNTGSGLYAIALGQLNTASGSNTVAIGYNSVANNSNAVAIGNACNSYGTSSVALGKQCTANLDGSIALGRSCQATGNSGSAAIGNNSIASGTSSIAIGTVVTASGAGTIAVGSFLADNSRGYMSLRGNGYVTVNGASQLAEVELRASTLNNTPTRLGIFGSVSTANDTYVLPNNTQSLIKGRCFATIAGAADSAYFEFIATLSRGANAASTALVAAVSPSLITSNGTGNTWALSVTADTTLGGLNVTATGETGKTIRWMCALDAIELANTI